MTMKRTTLDETYSELLRATEERDKPKYVTDQCFLEPTPGRVIVKEDEAKGPSSIIITPQKTKTRPTTGHIVAAPDDYSHLVGRRVLFAQFSGTAVYFKGYPAWRVLQIEEILTFINKEDIEIDQDKLESMV